MRLSEPVRHTNGRNNSVCSHIISIKKASTLGIRSHSVAHRSLAEEVVAAKRGDITLVTILGSFHRALVLASQELELAEQRCAANLLPPAKEEGVAFQTLAALIKNELRVIIPGGIREFRLVLIEVVAGVQRRGTAVRGPCACQLEGPSILIRLGAAVRMPNVIDLKTRYGFRSLTIPTEKNIPEMVVCRKPCRLIIVTGD